MVAISPEHVLQVDTFARPSKILSLLGRAVVAARLVGQSLPTPRSAVQIQTKKILSTNCRTEKTKK